ncbi:acetate kinase [bacterium]|nr:acetate kinase [bacterium]
MKILVLNCGSSSLKFQLFSMNKKREKMLAGGFIDRIGGNQDSSITYYINHKKKLDEAQPIKDYDGAIKIALKTLCSSKYGIIKNIHEIDSIGHRVVHGGEEFTKSMLISEKVFQKIKDNAHLAPLHNPPNIKGIESSLFYIPFARQIAVFDTAFHQTMEPDAYTYALPYEWYEEKRIRRYGFHGTSHRYVAEEAAKIIGKPIEELKMVTCHLGNGASMTAIKRGISMDTSMGFTPLEGLVMGTRCGNIDPSIPLQIMADEGLSPNQMDLLLNNQSGLFGLTDGDSDMRTIEEKAHSGSERHKLALNIFTRQVKKYIGAYAAVMGGLDAIVFTAGIGEKSAFIREKICEELDFLGIQIDEKQNEKNNTVISKGMTFVLIVPTNEELAIAREVMKVLINESNNP